MPRLAVINESSVAADAAIQAMLPAHSRQWNSDLMPVWPIESATVSFVAVGHAPPAGTWWVVFLEDSDQANALAYHDLWDEGLPISKVFVKSILADKASLSVGATHEICEMAVDPRLNAAHQDPTGTFCAGEICDPVEDDCYGYPIDGTLVTDFVTPSWFAHAHSPSPIDFNHHASKAFEVLTGGYAQKYDAKRGWVQVTGASARHSRRALAPIGSRRERRACARRRARISSGKPARALPARGQS